MSPPIDSGSPTVTDAASPSTDNSSSAADVGATNADASTAGLQIDSSAIANGAPDSSMATLSTPDYGEQNDIARGAPPAEDVARTESSQADMSDDAAREAVRDAYENAGPAEGGGADRVPATDLVAQADARLQLAELEANGKIIGGDREALANWHVQGQNDQGYKNDCVPASANDVAKSAGAHSNETLMIENGIRSGVIDQSHKDPADNGGSSIGGAERLLESVGVPAHNDPDSSFEHVGKLVDDGHGVVAQANAGQLWKSHDPADWGDVSRDGSFQANHAVRVTNTVRDQNGDLLALVINDSAGNPIDTECSSSAGPGPARYVSMTDWEHSVRELEGDRSICVTDHAIGYGSIS